MHSAGNARPHQKQQQRQIELQVRQDDSSPALQRSVLLPSGAPRSDDFVLAVEHSNGIHSYSSTDTNGSPQGTALVEGPGSFTKAGDAHPLLASNDSLSSGEEDGSLRNPSEESDFHAGGASIRSAVFNLSTSIVGAGIMALPASMRVLGVLPAIVLILIIGMVSEVTVEMVILYTSQMKTLTYGGMVYGALGKKGRLLSQICIIVSNGGILIVYMIIMGDVLSGSKDHTGLFESWVGGEGWWTNRSVVLLLTMIFVLAPLSFLKRIDSLEITSGVSVALAMLFVLLTTGIAFFKLVQGKLSTPRMFPAFESKNIFLDLLTVIPVMTNAFICQFNIPTIYSELRERNTTTMNKVGRISTGLCVALYAVTALSGYLLFGELTASDVLSNFDTDLGIPHSHFWNDLIRVGFVVHLFFVFPVIHFSFRTTVDSLLFPEAAALAETNLRFGLLTLVSLTVIYIGSTVIPNIWVAFKFVGATTGISMGFIFPSLVAIKMKGGGKREQKLAWGILVMAVVVGIVGFTTEIYTSASGKS